MKLKKMICMLLVILLLLGIPVTISAADMKEDSPFLEYHSFGSNNGYEICIIHAAAQPMELCEVIGDYCFFGPYLPGGFDSQTAIYAVKGEEKIYLKDACDQGLIDMDEVSQMIDGFRCDEKLIQYSVVMLGDINMNKKLEVADVIFIQQYLAKSFDTSLEVLLDVDKNGTVNMEDILLLQKKIAKIV